MNDHKDFEDAIKTYKLVVEKYSGSKLEEKAQFMVGFVYANYIHNYDKAQVEYNKFLERFPDHDLSDDVKFEIENLGKDINDIPQLKDIVPQL